MPRDDEARGMTTRTREPALPDPADPSHTRPAVHPSAPARSSNIHVPSRGAPSRRLLTAVPRPVLLAATLTSALTAAIGLLWLFAPPVRTVGIGPEGTLLASLFGAHLAAGAQTVTALLGLAAGIAALGRSLPRRGLLAVSALQALVGGVALGSMSTLSTTGYLLAFAMPAIVLLLIVQVIRTYPRGRWIVGVPALLAVGIGIVLLRDLILELGGYLLPALLGDSGSIAVTLLLVATGATWIAAAVFALRGTGTAERSSDLVRRHRVLLTLVAACGPLPYALARLTWLTPWPLFGGEAAADPATQLWGLTLSTGCWLGVVLTLGLIRPWGEVFPRWMPGVAGRPVPIAAAAIPGGAIAALLSFAAIPLLVSAFELGPWTMLQFAIIFPCWLWGPALGLAVWGYVAHRRAADPTGPADSFPPDGSTPATGAIPSLSDGSTPTTGAMPSAIPPPTAVPLPSAAQSARTTKVSSARTDERRG